MQGNKYKSEIYEILAKYSILFEATPPIERIQGYAECLSKYNPGQITVAFNKLVVSSKFFPALSEIIHLIEMPVNSKDEAMEMVEHILTAARKIGQHREEKAKETLEGPLWNAVERFGGWHAICVTEIGQMQSVRAQLRDSCMSVMTYKKKKHAQEAMAESNDRLMGATVKALDVVK